MLDQSLKEQVRSLFSSLENQYILKVIASENNSERDNLVSLISDLSDTSDKISVEVESGDSLELKIYKNGAPAGFLFKAVPTGHEFTTLLLGILNLDGKGKNFPDDLVANRIKALKGDILIKSFISLTCTNCPEVVQTINMMTIINPRIRHEIIDGALYEEEAKALNIQAVPTVFAGDKLLTVGRTPLAEILDKLEQQYGKDESAVNNVPVNKSYDVLIIGGGPAGTSAAVYSARKGLKVGIVAERMGGQILETDAIENMISIINTTGKQLADNMGLHISDYPVDILTNRRVEDIEIKEGQKVIRTNLGEEISTPALIVATGASWRKLGVPGESDYIGSGIAFCTHCDGPFYKGKKVAVIGGGNSGLEAAIDLASIATHVTVLEYGSDLKGDQVLQEKLKALKNVTILTQVQTTEIKGDGKKVTGLEYKNLKDDAVTDIVVDGVFIQIGLRPNSGVFDKVVEINRAGEIIIDANCRTNIPGIYAAGDVSTVPFKQIIIAMGEGAKASLSAFDDRLKNKLLG